MCLAIPTQIVAIEATAPFPQATVVLEGVERRISLALTPEAQVGDYVLVHTGYALSRVDADEAQETLAMLAEMAAHQ